MLKLNLTANEIALHDKLYADAWALIAGEIHLQGGPALDMPAWRSRRKLDKAISLFERTLDINPDSWNSLWALGKIHQRLNEHSAALAWFSKAHEIEPDNPDILREGAICAMKVGNGRAAVAFATAALKLKPDDAGLLSNLALALLLDGRTKEAKEKAAAAIRANPERKIARTVQKLIEDVISGRTPCPRTLA